MISAASGSNIMTYDEFTSYTSPVGIYSLNTPRNLQFASNCFFKSPNQPLNCTYDANVTALEPCILNNAIKELNDTTWGELAENVCAIYYPSLSTNVTLGPPAPGQMLVGPISKCQSMTFTAGDQWVRGGRPAAPVALSAAHRSPALDQLLERSLTTPCNPEPAVPDRRVG